MQRPRAAGISGGLALLSGPSVWAGLLGLGLAWILRRTMETSSGRLKDEKEAAETAQIPDGLPSMEFAAAPGARAFRREDLKVALIFAGAAILLGGTLFLLSPGGLSAWLDALPAYVRGWVQPSGVPAGRLLFGLLVYQPLAVLFGLAAVLRGWIQRRRRNIRLSLWLLAALLVVLFYPARQVGDLAWALIPLWGLAALELSYHTRIFREERREVAGMALLIFILLVFAWLDYAGIALDPSNPANLTSNAIQVGGTVLFENLPPTRYVLLLSVVLLLAVSIFMVALGWSARTARLGSVWGFTLAFGIYSLGMAWSGTGLRTPGGWELWWPNQQPDQASLLLQTVNQQSEWSTGNALSQEVSLLNVDSPALEWLLRGRNLKKVSVLEPEDSPAIVISGQIETLNLPTAYRGQDFSWEREPYWDIVGMYEWIRWTVFRDMPFQNETVIVWVRNDLFLDTSQSLSQ
jgi:hypothetical protein